MTRIEILAARLAESVLMDWDKEQQVELAKKLAVELLKEQSEEETEPFKIKPIEPLDGRKSPDLFPPIAVMYGVQPIIFTNPPAITVTTDDINIDNSNKK